MLARTTKTEDLLIELTAKIGVQRIKVNDEAKNHLPPLRQVI